MTVAKKPIPILANLGCALVFAALILLILIHGYSEDLNSRGLAYYAKGDNARAIQDYDQAIRINPDDADAFYNRANLYLEKGDYDRAIHDYDQAIRINDLDTTAIANRSIAYRAKVNNEPGL